MASLPRGVPGQPRRPRFGGAALVVALLSCLAAPLGFVARPWPSQAPQLAPARRARSAVSRRQAEPAFDAAVIQAVDAKQRLRQAMHMRTIEELEDMWRDSVTDMAQLKGEWTMQVPTVGDVKGWMKAHGAALGLELVGSPVLKIDGKETGECVTNIKWGFQKDVVTQTSRLTITTPSVIRDKPTVVRTKYVKLSILPHLKKSRTIRVTYLDSELMIIRDSNGAVDALWRTPVKQATRPVQRRPQQVRQAAPQPRVEAPRVASFDQLQGRVEALKAVIEAGSERAAKDRELTAQLTQEAAELEKSLESSEIDSMAIAARLKALSSSQANAAMSKELAAMRAGEEMGILLEQTKKADELESRLEEAKILGSKLGARLLSSQAQVKALSKGWWGFGSEARLRRAAYKVAQREARERQQKVVEARKAERAIFKELKKTLMQVERQEKALEAATEREMRAAQGLEVEASSLSLEGMKDAVASQKKEALLERLASINAQLSELEKRTADVDNVASDVQRTMAQVAAEAREVKRTARKLREGGSQRRWR